MILTEEKYGQTQIKKFIKNRYILCVEIKELDSDWLFKKSVIPIGPHTKDNKDIKGKCEYCGSVEKLEVTCKCKEVFKLAFLNNFTLLVFTHIFITYILGLLLRRRM